MNFFKSIPLGVSGVALACAGLGNLIAYQGGLVSEPASKYLRYGLGFIALFALVLLVARIIADPHGVIKDLESPVVLSMMPASTMATILLTIYLIPYAPVVAKIIWGAAAVIQVCIMAVFAVRHVLDFQLVKVYPSWFVATVGIQAIAIASPYMGALPVGQAAFWLGFMSYFCVLALVIIRYVKHRPLPEKYRPTIMVLTAPIGICIVGYVSVFPQPNVTLLSFMMIVGAFSYLIALVALPGLIRLPFYPSHAALGFPMVVSAFAFKRGGEILITQGYLAGVAAKIMTAIVYIAELFAIVIVCFVIARYTNYLYTQLRKGLS
ncbi:MAG: TDT family transporter [Coriobacteriia bacterium]|nr:TDT family transporter [Coriobacteriia bacterium]MCL2870254.1 TDT family transporter [Coriobacteriia bacterium]